MKTIAKIQRQIRQLSYIHIALYGIFLINVFNPTNALASIGTAADIKYHSVKNHVNDHEKAYSAWAISFDNDILVPASRDQDYTYGTSLTISGSATRNYRLSLHPALNWLNKRLGIGDDSQAINHSFEFGLYGFTPEDRTAVVPNTDDRPYASIVYLSNTQELATSSPNTVWRSTLTLGVLGLDIVGDIQNEVHRATDSEKARGWQNQISDGGELSARYSIARQTRWNLGKPNFEFKTTTQASVGYLTEVSLGANLRVGKINSRWQSYNPELTSYGEQSNQSVNKQSTQEHYFTIGTAIKARLYNAFLQGQFRDSDFEYNNNDLNHSILEVWAGYTYSFANNYRISYLLRAHSSEVKSGVGDRSVIWGGLTLSKVY